MCGIAGWIDFRRDLSGESATGRAMADSLACRGPDDSAVWLSAHALLGHRRLAVIDPAGGKQPMCAEESGHTLAAITFCGEIYNFRDLRAELEARGHQFRTMSDTEVLLRSYLEWGESFTDRLTGMFAFGIWDCRREELLLARDRMGVKPLYYYPTPDGVLFGSEPKAIFAHPLASPRVDAEGLCEVLDMVKTPEHAVYSGMSEVRPGQLVRVRATGISRFRYWELTAREHEDDQATTVATVRGLLEDIVGGQLFADVPVCMLLSGGLDSSAVTALAAQSWPGGRVHTYSLDFVGTGRAFEPDAIRDSSDAPFARLLADHVGAVHTEVRLNSPRLLDPELRSAVLRATDLPPAFWGDMWPSLYLLFKEIRGEFTVALSGESADELFGGYRWFHNSSATGAATFPWLTSGSARYFGGLRLLDEGFLRKLDIPGYRKERYAEAVREVPVLPGEAPEERRMRQVTYLNLTRFVQTLLDRKDRMSMAVGLEVRVPFCDHRLVEYVFNVPWAMKTFDGMEKSLLRAAARDLLPAAIADRRKNPYPATQDPAYEEGLRAELAAALAKPDVPVRDLLDTERCRTALERPLAEISQPYNRGSLEMALWLNEWLATYRVSLDL